MDIIIEFKDVEKSFDGKTALTNLSFKIEKNEFVALVGNNGCGKSTTINILCGIINSRRGIVEVFNRKINYFDGSYKHNLGILLSKPHYIEDFNVREYLMFVGRFQRTPDDLVRNRVSDLISLFSLQENTKSKIKSLSSGNQMKVRLAATLIHNPEILVLDEPFVNLDFQTINDLTQILNSFKGRKTLLIASHDLDIVAELCDRFLIMDSGKIVDEVKRKDLSTAELKEEIKRHLVQKSISVKEFDWLR